MGKNINFLSLQPKKLDDYYVICFAIPIWLYYILIYDLFINSSVIIGGDAVLFLVDSRALRNKVSYCDHLILF